MRAARLIRSKESAGNHYVDDESEELARALMISGLEFEGNGGSGFIPSEGGSSTSVERGQERGRGGRERGGVAARHSSVTTATPSHTRQALGGGAPRPNRSMSGLRFSGETEEEEIQKAIELSIMQAAWNTQVCREAPSARMNLGTGSNIAREGGVKRGSRSSGSGIQRGGGAGAFVSNPGKRGAAGESSAGGLGSLANGVSTVRAGRPPSNSGSISSRLPSHPRNARSMIPPHTNVDDINGALAASKREFEQKSIREEKAAILRSRKEEEDRRRMQEDAEKAAITRSRKEEEDRRRNCEDAVEALLARQRADLERQRKKQDTHLNTILQSSLQAEEERRRAREDDLVRKAQEESKREYEQQEQQEREKRAEESRRISQIQAKIRQEQEQEFKYSVHLL